MWASKLSNAFHRADATGHGEQESSCLVFPTAREEETASSQTVLERNETFASGVPVVLVMLETLA